MTKTGAVLDARLAARTAAEASRALRGQYPNPPSPDSTDLLAREIHHAIDAGHLPLAERLVVSAIRLDRRRPEVAEAVARFYLAQAKPEAAIAAVDAAVLPQWSLRLLRATALLDLERTTEAHMLLLDAADDPDAPDEARRLLALLQLQAGEIDRARRSLARCTQGGVASLEVDLIRLLAALQATDGDAAKEVAARLRRLCVYPTIRRPIRILLASVGLDATGQTPSASHTDIETLSRELCAAQALLPILMEAQRRSFDAPSARLLQEALMRTVNEFEDGAAAYSAIAELTLHLDGAAAADRWTDLGLALHPMSSSLQRIRSEIATVMRDHQTDSPAPRMELAVLATMLEPKPEREAESLAREKAA